MTKARRAPRTYPDGTLQRALADAAARAAAGGYVDPRDLGGGRTTAPEAPDPLVTPDGRA